MKKLNLIAMLLLTQATSAANVQSSHPIYFNGGTVSQQQSAYFDLPYQQMSPGVLYDLSCSITGDDITSYQPILNVKLVGDKMRNQSYPIATSLINGIVVTYPFQDRLIAKNNTLVIHNFSYSTCDTTSPITLKVYNFDNVEPVIFSSCYIIVSKQNA